MYSDTNYEREKHHIAKELETLVVPQADKTVKAGELIENLPELWEEARKIDATVTEPRRGHGL